MLATRHGPCACYTESSSCPKDSITKCHDILTKRQKKTSVQPSKTSPKFIKYRACHEKLLPNFYSRLPTSLSLCAERVTPHMPMKKVSVVLHLSRKTTCQTSKCSNMFRQCNACRRSFVRSPVRLASILQDPTRMRMGFMVHILLQNFWLDPCG